MKTQEILSFEKRYVLTTGRGDKYIVGEFHEKLIEQAGLSLIDNQGAFNTLYFTKRNEILKKGMLLSSEDSDDIPLYTDNLYRVFKFDKLYKAYCITKITNPNPILVGDKSKFVESITGFMKSKMEEAFTNKYKSKDDFDSLVDNLLKLCLRI